MGSTSDWETMQHADKVLSDFGVAHECQIVSAHRTPDRLIAYAKTARERGLKMLQPIEIGALDELLLREAAHEQEVQDHAPVILKSASRHPRTGGI